MLFTLCCVFSSCPRGVRLRADRKLKTDELLRSLGGLFRVGKVRLGTLRANKTILFNLWESTLLQSSGMACFWSALDMLFSSHV